MASIEIGFDRAEESTGAMITLDGVEIGAASIITEGDSMPYVERVDIFDGYRGQGYGTQLLRAIAEEIGEYAIAPDNADAARLYARLGSELGAQDYDDWGFAVDQGYGVYSIY